MLRGPLLLQIQKSRLTPEAPKLGVPSVAVEPQPSTEVAPPDDEPQQSAHRVIGRCFNLSNTWQVSEFQLTQLDVCIDFAGKCGGS